MGASLLPIPVTIIRTQPSSLLHMSVGAEWEAMSLTSELESRSRPTSSKGLSDQPQETRPLSFSATSTLVLLAAIVEIASCVFSC